MSKLALLVGAGFPLMLAASPALAQSGANGTAPAAPVAVAPGAAPRQTVVVTPVAAPAGTPPSTVVVTAPAGTTVVVEKPLVLVDGLMQVHINTKELVTVEHRSGPGAPWQVACETPCDTRLPAGDQYRIVGEGLNPSEPFALTSPKGEEVKIYVAPGFKKKEKTGEILTISGGVVAVGAIVIGLVAADPGRTFTANGNTDNYNWNVIAVGTGIAVAGLATAIVGGAYWYNNAATRVAGDVQAEPPAHGGLEPRYQTGMRMTGPSLPTYGATLFSTSF